MLLQTLEEFLGRQFGADSRKRDSPVCAQPALERDAVEELRQRDVHYGRKGACRDTANVTPERTCHPTGETGDRGRRQVDLVQGMPRLGVLFRLVLVRRFLGRAVSHRRR